MIRSILVSHPLLQSKLGFPPSSQQASPIVIPLIFTCISLFLLPQASPASCSSSLSPWYDLPFPGAGCAGGGGGKEELDFWENTDPQPLPPRHSKLPVQLCSSTQQAKLFQGSAGIERGISRIQWQKCTELSSKKRFLCLHSLLFIFFLGYGNVGILPSFPSHLFPPNSRPPKKSAVVP